MPYKMTYLEGEGGVITTYWGTVTDDEVIEAGRRKCSSVEKMKSYRYVLTDCSDVEDFHVTVRGIQINANLANELSKVNKDVIVIFVLPTDLEFSMGKMWQAYSNISVVKSHLFRTRREADDWLRNRFN